MDWWKWMGLAALPVGVLIGWLVAGIAKGADKVAQEDPAQGDHE